MDRSTGRSPDLLVCVSNHRMTASLMNGYRHSPEKYWDQSAYPPIAGGRTPAFLPQLLLNDAQPVRRAERDDVVVEIV